MANDNTPVDFDATAAEVRSALETVLAKIPQFDFPRPEPKRARTLSTVPQAFIDDLTETVDSTDVGLNKVFDTAEARQFMKYVSAFRPIVTLANQVSASLDDSVRSAYAHVASSALDAYAITSRVARKGGDPIHVKAQSARRALSKRFPSHRRTKAPPPPASGNPQ